MYEIEYSTSALSDIKNIFQYSIENFGELAAKKYLNNLHAFIEKLSKMPTRGHRRRDLQDQFLTYQLEQHTIIYLIDEDHKSIIIVRLLHNKMNFGDLDL
jgi:toxin ParE1/3/4